VYWRLSSFYLFYFAALGALIPYWGVYLKSIGYDAQAIGELVAVLMATKVIAPNIWGWLADRSPSRMAVVRSASFIAALGFSLIFFGQGYGWLMLVMILFSFFWNAALPQFEAVTMSHLDGDTHSYSVIRLWGSVGFVVAVVVLGEVIGRFDADILPVVVLAMLALIGVSSLFVPDARQVVDSEPKVHFGEVMRRPGVIALLLVCFLMQLSHGPYYTFYSIYLEEHGYSHGVIGVLWGVGVIAEIMVFIWMSRLVRRFGLRGLLILSLLAACLRWLLIAWFVDSPVIITLAQLLHAASFGIYHAVAITLIHQRFTGRYQGMGQALYSSLSFGAGGAVGSLYSGYLWDTAGPAVTFSISALACLVAYWVVWRYLRDA